MSSTTSIQYFFCSCPKIKFLLRGFFLLLINFMFICMCWLICSDYSDDSWIEIKPDQLDDMLNKLSGKNASLEQDAFNLQKVSESMKTFVEKISSHEGAEFPK